MLSKAMRVSVLAGVTVLLWTAPASAQTATPQVSPTPPPALSANAHTTERPGLLGPSSDVWQHVTFDANRSHATTADRSLLGDIAGDFKRFFTARETYGILAVGLAGALSVHGVDERIARSPFNSERPDGGFRTADALLDPGATLGGAGMQLGGALATWGVGHWLDKPGVADLGRDLLRAQILAQSVTHAIKLSVGRTRPDLSAANSFPSGHTSSAFATATVLRNHYGWKVGGPAYAVAAYIAASRLSENRHYLSDVVFGAAIGLAAGRAVGFSAGGTRFEVSPLVAAGGGGVNVSISR